MAKLSFRRLFPKAEEKGEAGLEEGFFLYRAGASFTLH